MNSNQNFSVFNQYQSEDVKNLLADMRLGQIRHHMARIESIAPDFTLVNQDGDLVNLNDTLEKAPVILGFAAEYACEFGQLATLANDQNAKLLIVAPHKRWLDEHRNQCNLINAEILHDVGNFVANQYGLTQFVSNDRRYEEFVEPAIDFRTTDLDAPVPAIYAINAQGRIVFSYVKTEPKFEINVNELRETLTLSKPH